MGRPIEWQEVLCILESSDPQWLAQVLFSRSQTDPVLEKLCQLKAGIEKAKRGDLEALRRGLESALDLQVARGHAHLSDDFDLILTQSIEDFATLRDLPRFEESIRPLLAQFTIHAASVSTQFEEGFGWWSALEDLCVRLNLPVPDTP